MTTITDLQAVGIGAPGTQITGETSQDSFLTLMLAQLQNQDPMEPLENGEFLSQLAAFETAAGVSSLEDSFNVLAGSLYTNQSLQATGLIGHSVIAPSDTAQLTEGGLVEGTVIVPASSNSVVVEITNATGELVRRVDLGQQAEGEASFEWDGLDGEGNPMPPGEYTLDAQVSVDGEVVTARTLINAQVESVSLDAFTGSILLNLAGGTQVPFSQVNEIM